MLASGSFGRRFWDCSVLWVSKVMRLGYDREFMRDINVRNTLFLCLENRCKTLHTGRPNKGRLNAMSCGLEASFSRGASAQTLYRHVEVRKLPWKEAQALQLGGIRCA